MERDAEKLARTQVVFRSANEAISRNTVGQRQAGTFLCECVDERCMALVELTARDYEQVRSDPHGFLLMSGHEEPGDVIVKQSERFTLVRKTGAGARIAGAFDPRGGG